MSYRAAGIFLDYHAVVYHAAGNSADRVAGNFNFVVNAVDFRVGANLDGCSIEGRVLDMLNRGLIGHRGGLRWDRGPFFYLFDRVFAKYQELS